MGRWPLYLVYRHVMGCEMVPEKASRSSTISMCPRAEAYDRAVPPPRDITSRSIPGALRRCFTVSTCPICDPSIELQWIYESCQSTDGRLIWSTDEKAVLPAPAKATWKHFEVFQRIMAYECQFPKESTHS
jgi:hypothetical protein